MKIIGERERERAGNVSRRNKDEKKSTKKKRSEIKGGGEWKRSLVKAGGEVGERESNFEGGVGRKRSAKQSMRALHAHHVTACRRDLTTNAIACVPPAPAILFLSAPISRRFQLNEIRSIY